MTFWNLFGGWGHGGHGGYGGHDSYSSTSTYEFTAFTEADLLGSSNGKDLGCGDVFTMPSCATTCFSVKDDDKKLSGDACRDESGDDTKYQTADIEVKGEKVFDNAGIYAEQYHKLYGSDGEVYYLIEIEVKNGDAPGKGDDFFTFYGDVPPAGVTLTLVKTENVTSEWLEYKKFGAGEKWSDKGDDCTDCEFVIEAESMELCGYKAEYNSHASGDKLIVLKDDYGYAKTDFGGKDGTYDVTVTYVDESDGRGMIDVYVNGVRIGTVKLDKDNNGDGTNAKTFSTITFEGIAINEGDEIKLKGRGDRCEFVRIDKITFDGCEPPNENPTADDDAGKLCSDAATVIAVLDGDIDPDGDALTITAIDGQAIAAGETITLTASGAQVTLELDGTITYDLSGAGDTFDTLEIGQEAVDSFTYTVSDGNGGSADATVTVDVCGALNTLSSMDNSFVDENGQRLTVTYANQPVFDAEVGGFTYDLVVVSDDPRLGGLTGTKVYENAIAYCIDESGQRPPFGGPNMQVEAEVFVADPDDPDLAGVVGMPENLDLITWIINQRFDQVDSGALEDTPRVTGENYNVGEIQYAVWALSDGISISDYDSDNNGVVDGFTGVDVADVEELIAAAIAGGEGFTPGEGDLVGLILSPTDDLYQKQLIGVPFEDLAQDCLCG